MPPATSENTNTKPKGWHLTAGAQRVLAKGPQARRNWVRRNALIRYPGTTKVLRTLQAALYRGSEQQPVEILLNGPKGNGKTTLLESVLEEHGRTFVETARQPNLDIVKPMIRPQPPEADGPIYAASAMLCCLHGGSVGNAEEAVERTVLFLKRHCQVQLIVLDRWPTPNDEVRETLKKIGVESHTSLVFTTDQPAGAAEEWASAAKNRIHLHLPAWEPGQRMARLLSLLERDIPLPKQSGLADQRTMERITREAGSSLGQILATVRHAASRAIAEGQPRIEARSLHRIARAPSRQ